MARYKHIDTSPQFLALILNGSYLCDRQGLIGREMCAIDGVKLSLMHQRTRTASAPISNVRPPSLKPSGKKSALIIRR